MRALEECSCNNALGLDGLKFSFIKVGWDFLKADYFGDVTRISLLCMPVFLFTFFFLCVCVCACARAGLGWFVC